MISKEDLKYEEYIQHEELEKAIQNVLNSLTDKPRSFGASKFILQESIKRLENVCIIKNSV